MKETKKVTTKARVPTTTSRVRTAALKKLKIVAAKRDMTLLDLFDKLADEQERMVEIYP